MTYVSRRSFMQGAAGLVVAFSLPRVAAASATTVAADSVDAYLAVAPDGGVTVFAGKVDLGTGARAAIRQIVAEELSLSPKRIALIEGDTALTPDQGSTGGSTGIMVGGVQIRQAAATARAHLLALGAARLNRPATDLETRDGAVASRSSGEAVSFAALIGGATFNVPVDKSAPLRDPDTYTIVGTSYPRPDIPAKLTARHVYVQDHRVDGMWHARVVRPPAIGAKLLDVDAGSIAAIPQAQIVRIARFSRRRGAARVGRGARHAGAEGDVERCGDAAGFGCAVRCRARNAGRPHRDAAQRRRRDRGARSGAARHPRLLCLADPVARARWGRPARSPTSATAAARCGPRRKAHIVCARRSRKLLGLDVAKLRLDLHGRLGQLRHERQRRRRLRGGAAVARAAPSGARAVDARGRARLGSEGPAAAARSARDARRRRRYRRVGNGRDGAGQRAEPAGHPVAGAPSPPGLDDGARLFSGLLSLNADPPYADCRTCARRSGGRRRRRCARRTCARPARSATSSPSKASSTNSRRPPASIRSPIGCASCAIPRGREVLERVGAMMKWTRAHVARPSGGGKTLNGRGIAYVHYKQAENYVAMGMEVAVDTFDRRHPRAARRLRPRLRVDDQSGRRACAGRRLHPADAEPHAVRGSHVRSFDA